MSSVASRVVFPTQNVPVPVLVLIALESIDICTSSPRTMWTPCVSPQSMCFHASFMCVPPSFMIHVSRVLGHGVLKVAHDSRIYSSSFLASSKGGDERSRPSNRSLGPNPPSTQTRCTGCLAFLHASMRMSGSAWLRARTKTHTTS